MRLKVVLLGYEKYGTLSINRRFSIRSHDSLSLVTPNNKTLTKLCQYMLWYYNVQSQIELTSSKNRHFYNHVSPLSFSLYIFIKTINIVFYLSAILLDIITSAYTLICLSVFLYFCLPFTFYLCLCLQSNT